MKRGLRPNAHGTFYLRLFASQRLTQSVIIEDVIISAAASPRPVCRRIPANKPILNPALTLMIRSLNA